MAVLAILLHTLTILPYSSAQQQPNVTASTITSLPYTTTSIIFLPSALFNPFPSPQIFTGQVTTTGSTTYYSLTYELGISLFNPHKVPHTVGGYDEMYYFSASAAGTQYSLPQQTTVTCGLTNSRGTAACTTLFPGAAAATSSSSSSSSNGGYPGPANWEIDNAESSVYLAYFTSSAPFPEGAANTAYVAATASSTTSATGTGGARTTLGFELGVPLGVCGACALLGVVLLLLLRCRRRKRRLAGGDGGAGDKIGDGKMVDSGEKGPAGDDVAELNGVEAEVGGRRNELEGSFVVGREELA